MFPKNSDFPRIRASRVSAHSRAIKHTHTDTYTWETHKGEGTTAPRLCSVAQYSGQMDFRFLRLRFVQRAPLPLSTTICVAFSVYKCSALYLSHSRCRVLQLMFASEHICIHVCESCATSSLLASRCDDEYITLGSKNGEICQQIDTATKTICKDFGWLEFCFLIADCELWAKIWSRKKILIKFTNMSNFHFNLYFNLQKQPNEAI